MEQTNFQSSIWVKEKAVKQLSENNNRSVSGMFREFRKYPHYSLLGDYILLASIGGALEALGLPKVREDFSYAMRQSEEFKEIGKAEKGELLDQLIMPSVELKVGKRPSSKSEPGQEIRRDTNGSLTRRTLKI